MLGVGFVHLLVNSVPRFKALFVDDCEIGSWDGGHMVFEMVKMKSHCACRSGLFGETG